VHECIGYSRHTRERVTRVAQAAEAFLVGCARRYLVRLLIKAWQKNQTEWYCKAEEKCRQVVVHRPPVRVDFGDEIEAEVPQRLSISLQQRNPVRTKIYAQTAAPAQQNFTAKATWAGRVRMLFGERRF